MKSNRYFFTVMVSIVLLVSVFSAASAFSAGMTEDDMGMRILVHERSVERDFLDMYPAYNIVEEYDSYLLVETSVEDVQSLEDRGYIVEELVNGDYVGLQSYSFNTGEGEPEIPEELKIEEYSDQGEGYYIVQFIGPIKGEWLERLEEEGAELHEFRHRFNYVVEMNSDTRSAVEELDFVEWTGIHQPAYRFDKELLERTEPLYLDVSFFEGTEIGPIADGMVEFEADIHYIGEDRVSLEVEPHEIVDLANLPGVRSITEGSDEHHVFNARATWVTQTNQQNYRKITEQGVTGEGELITVMDSGLFKEHEAFADDENQIGDDHRKIQDLYVPEGGEGNVSAGHMHGTHVTGTVLGESPSYGEYSNHDGNALEARVLFQDVSEDGQSIGAPENMYDNAYGDAYDRGSRVHTNSWGASGEGEYTDFTEEADEFIWDHKDFNILFAAGNDGDGESTVSPQSSGKNVIAVGALEGGAGEGDMVRGGGVFQEEQDDVASFSSRGYALDGRIKPDIMHIGDEVTSADYEDATGYGYQSGTSMSCPGIAGQVGQVRDYYKSGWYPSGSPNEADGWEPSNALVRATLINSAVEVSGGGAYLNDERFPNNDQGFGRSKLDRAMYFEGDNRDVKVYDSLEEGHELGTGESWDMEFIVDDPNQELEITLAWTDAPGTPGSDESDPAIVNDLDLEVEGPFGRRFVGNAFTGHDPGYSEPDPEDNFWSGLRGEEFDGLNVIENVLLLPDHNDVEEGRYEVTVTGHNVPMGSQPFAVVVSGGGIRDPVPGEPPEIDVTHPVGGEEFDAYDQVQIEWDTTQTDDPINYINLDYSIDGGVTWKEIERTLDDTGTYQWTVPNWDSEECRVRATAVDEEYRTSYDSSGTFTIEGIPPEAPGWLEVDRHTLDGEMVENKDFVDDYEPWELTRLQEEGQARWDHDNYDTGGSIYVETYQMGDGTSTEEAYWEQELDPIASEMVVSAAFRRNIEIEDGDFGSGDVNHGTAEVLVHDSETGWETVLIDESTIEYDTGWTELDEEVIYDPTGYVDTVRARMHVEAEGYTDPLFGFEYGALAEIWMDDISVHVEDGLEDAHNIINWEASGSPAEEVSHYNIYRAEESTGPWDDPIAEIEDDGSSEYSYIDPNKGAEDDVLWWYVVRGVGINGLEEDNIDAVREPLPGDPPSITITAPEGGEYWLAGSEEEIAWTTTEGEDPVEDIDLCYSVDGGDTWTEIESGLSDTGSYTWSVPDEPSDRCLVRGRAWDEMERASEFDQSDGYFEIVDPDEVDAPMVEVISPVDAYLDESDVLVEWESENADYHEIRLNDDEWIDKGTDTEHMFEGLEDSEYSVEVRAVGEKELTYTDEVGFTVDTVNPTVEIVSPEEDYLASTDTITVEWIGEDENSGIDFYELVLNEDEVIDKGTDTEHTFEGLEDGEHHVEVQAFDKAGNTRSHAVTFTVDTSPPEIDITSPEEDEWISESSVTIRWDKEDEASPVQHQEILVNEEIVVEDETGDWIQYELTDLEDGTYTVEVRATNEDGREGADQVTFAIDTEAPDLEIVSPDSGEAFNVAEVTIEWESGSKGSDIQMHEIRLDGNEWEEVDSDNSHTFEGLENGDYIAEVKALDEAGNEAVESVTFSINTVPPSVEITSPRSGEAINQDEVTIYWDMDGTDIQEFEVRLNEGDWEEGDSEDRHVFEGLSDGRHTMEVRITDAAGNHDVDDISVVIDTTPPELDITSPELAAEIDRNTVTVEWESESVGTDIVDYRVRINDGEWIQPDGNTFHTFDELDDGSYTVEIRVQDEAGNINTESVYFTVDAPMVDSSCLWWLLIPLLALILIVFVFLRKRRDEDEEEGDAEVLTQATTRQDELDSKRVLKKKETTDEEEETSEFTGSDRKAWDEPQEETTEEEVEETQECPICGAQLELDAEICSKCGEPLVEEEDDILQETEDIDGSDETGYEETEEDEFEEEKIEQEEETEKEETSEEEKVDEKGVIECEVCGREVSADADKCWACGEKMNED